MTIRLLVPCASCSRHIAASETTCPFCASVVPGDLASRAVPGTNRRLSRFAMFTFATTASTATVLSACGSSEMSVPVYGASCTDPEQCNYSQDSGVGFNDDGGVGPLYGLADASVVDGGSPGDASFTDANDDSGDAGEDAD